MTSFIFNEKDMDELIRVGVTESLDICVRLIVPRSSRLMDYCHLIFCHRELVSNACDDE